MSKLHNIFAFKLYFFKYIFNEWFLCKSSFFQHLKMFYFYELNVKGINSVQCFIHLVEKFLEMDLKTFSKSLPGQCGPCSVYLQLPRRFPQWSRERVYIQIVEGVDVQPSNLQINRTTTAAYNPQFNLEPAYIYPPLFRNTILYVLFYVFWYLVF